MSHFSGIMSWLLRQEVPDEPDPQNGASASKTWNGLVE